MTGPGTPATRGAQPRVIPAEAADLDTLSQVIADAFHDLPPSLWLIADPDDRREIFPGYFRLYAEHAMANGVIHTTTDRDAVALWIHVGQKAAAQPTDYDARLCAATGRWIDRFLAFDETLDRHHPTGVPHHHLAILAVRPGQQGNGAGSALLRGYHQILDQDAGLPAYLEAGDLRTLPFYERHGYVLLANAPFYLPGGGPPMWPMWREPGRTALSPARARLYRPTSRTSALHDQRPPGHEPDVRQHMAPGR